VLSSKSSINVQKKLTGKKRKEDAAEAEQYAKVFADESLERGNGSDSYGDYSDVDDEGEEKNNFCVCAFVYVSYLSVFKKITFFFFFRLATLYHVKYRC
jgi:hypothetical protein